MARVLIIACGNPLRCDDGLAWLVAEQLSRLVAPNDVEIIAQHQLTPELALAASQAGTVLFLDAAHGEMPGQIRSEPVTPAPTAAAFSHELSPASVLGLAQELYGRYPTALAISLSGECFDHGEVLSATVQANLPRMVSVVTDLIQGEKCREMTALSLI